MKEDFLLMNISWKGKEEPSLEDIAAYLDVPVNSLDKEFDVVNVDQENNIYTFRLRETEWNKLNKTDKDISGPFSDPKIEPFDLEQ